MVNVPERLPNQIGGRPALPAADRWFEKRSPHDGRALFEVARSDEGDVKDAVGAALDAQLAWAATPAVQRGHLLHAFCNLLEERVADVGEVVAAETAKSPADAQGETQGAIALGRFYAGEGQRLYGRTTTSATSGKYAMTVRMPVGVAGLIVAANTPIANVAWKAFPALIGGNAAVLKSAEDTPATAWLFAEIGAEAGLPPGVLNVVHGFGREAGAPLVAHPDVGVVSFTGSTAVGREIARVAGARLAKISLELGGKNPLVVCDDADLDRAVTWTIRSAFSNAGQRCSSGSRIIIFEDVYEQFRDLLVARTEKLSLGPNDGDDLGPVINERTLERVLAAVDRAREAGANVLTGGRRADSPGLRDGWYVEPTIVEGADPGSEMSTEELFGPVTALYAVPDLASALEMSDRSPYGLTAAIHTRSWDRAMEFAMKVRTGVAVVNAGTFGSEPHMPFGGLRSSGNGSREPGTEALDIYTELKDLYLTVDPTDV